jgi:hypothetical protein
MIEVIDDNPTNWLVLTPEGTETKSKDSKLNQLLYGHDLFGLIDRGDEIWQKSGVEDEPSVTVIPDEDALCYTIQLDSGPDLTLGANHKTELIDALAEVYDRDDGSIKPILDLYDRIREDMIRDFVLTPFAKAFSDKVEERDDGWLIYDHLLLTLEGDFFHPNTDSKQRSGSSVIPAGSNNRAYSGVNIGNPEQSMAREITVDGESYRLTTKEVTFLAKAIWAVQNTGSV